jgi:O-antigen/teichoic acid export membrane protein
MLLQDETLSKKLLTKGFRTYLFAFVIAPTGYLLRMFFSDAVSVAEVGIFYSVLGLMGLLSTYSDLGLTEAMMYFIPKYRINNEKNKARLVMIVSFGMQLLTGILIFCLVYFGADRLAINHFGDPIAADVLKILAFYFFGLNFITLCTTMFVSFQDTFSQGLTNSIQQIVNLTFTIIFRAMACLTVISFAQIRIIGVITSILTGGTLVRVKYRHVFRPDPEDTFLPQQLSIKKTVLKQHFNYAIRVFLVANVSNLLGNVGQQVIVNVLGPEAAGLFSNFQALLMVFLLIVTPMFGLLFPVTTELSTKQDHKKF